MRVGLVIYGSLDTVTGGFIYDRKLVDHLKTRGLSVEIYSLPWRNYVSHLADNFSLDFSRKLRDANIDILLQDELNHPSLLAANSSWFRSANYPIVSIVHHLRSSELRSEIVNRLYRAVEKRYLDSNDGFIFNSETTRDSVHSIEIKSKPFIVAQPGRNSQHPSLTPEFVRARAQRRGPLNLLFVGSLIRRKDLLSLLEALASIPKDEWTLKVVGSLETDRDYVDLVVKSLKRLQLGRNVKLLGTMDTRGLEAQYIESHVLAVPSSYEGYGIVYLESMGFGCPSLATTGGAAREIISDGLDGFLVAPGDTGAIADRIRLLATDRQILTRMGMAALNRFAAHPMWEQTCEKILQFIKEMVYRNNVY